MLLIYRASNCWVADFADTPDAEYMRELFGQTAIPLPLTAEATIQHVLDHLARGYLGEYEISLDARES